MLANMAVSLILHKRIRTTTAKAKALKVFVEPLITKSKEDSTHSRRVVFSYLQDKNAVTELFREVSPKIMQRPGGYTRILKTGIRLGDNADMCIIELVDYNENLLKIKEETAKAGRKRRRGGKKKTDEPTSAVGTIEGTENVPAEAEEPADITTVEEKSESAPEIKADAAEGDSVVQKEQPRAKTKKKEKKESGEKEKDTETKEG